MAFKYTSQPQPEYPGAVPEGDYTLVVIDAVETVSKAGSDMIKLTLEVEGHGSRVYDYLVFMPSTYWKIDAFRRATGEEVIEGEDVEVDPRDYLNRKGRARLKSKEYNGVTSNEVDMWLFPEPKKQAAAPVRKEVGRDPF